MPKYYDLIKLDRLLDSQIIPMGKLGPDESASHHEMFFIIIHQVYELWFKAINHELDSVMKTFRENPEGVSEREIGIIVHKLERIIEILKLLVAQVLVMETLTPLDFLDFRDRLLPASGYDSLQFHLLEVKLGLKLSRGRPYPFDPERKNLEDPEKGETKYGDNALAAAHIEELRAADKADSLFDYIEAWLERTPFLEHDDLGKWFEDDCKRIQRPGKKNPSVDKAIELIQGIFEPDEYRKFLSSIGEELGFDDREGLSHQAFLAALFIYLYPNEPILQNPHRLLGSLSEIDELFSVWRNWHSSMVLRMIGNKPGTAGKGFGYDYLAKTRAHRFFPELDRISTYMIPRDPRPPIRPEVLGKMEEMLFENRRAQR
jgi:tryptophan 2,3-dioxygenase